MKTNKTSHNKSYTMLKELGEWKLLYFQKGEFVIKIIFAKAVMIFKSQIKK